MIQKPVQVINVNLSKHCESLEELLNINGKLRTEGQTMWTLLGGILNQVTRN